MARAAWCPGGRHSPYARRAPPATRVAAVSATSTAASAASAVPATIGVAVSKHIAPRRRCAPAVSASGSIGPAYGASLKVSGIRGREPSASPAASASVHASRTTDSRGGSCTARIGSVPKASGAWRRKRASASSARSMAMARSGDSKQAISRPPSSSTSSVCARCASLRMTGVGAAGSGTGCECTDAGTASVARLHSTRMTTLDQQTAIRALRGCPLFAPCPEPVLADVGRRLRHRHFRRGEVIFHQGDPGDALHVIISGSVKIVLPSPEGEEAIIATLTEGDFFRELAEQHPELRDALFAALSSRLRRITHHVEELHFLDLAGRLAARLARLAREARHPSAGRIELDWPYAQSDLAAMIGGTRQSVNRLLADLIDDGLVRVEHERLIITY